ncbi:hypothetical protein HH310_28870 [Actinoplanes sp. TBRC 11911]|uniref:hypothetical protein n=1 Tax=Actinoplanes sp. TBRC 11911 TaxID=2729386 RepID=UPI00145D9665|nr:hypothetical protein [Actinoplanes sp. TBRC 11911]NMO55185.1 hypothetical protein [Actinoplanes sp. TBRC 11911]
MTDLLAELGAPGAGSLAAAAREMIGPYSDALTPKPLPWDDDAHAAVTVPGDARLPLLLVTLLDDLGTGELVLRPGPVTFAPWSQAGSALPIVVAPGSSTELTSDGRTAAQIRDAVRVDLVEGLAGRLMAVLLAEKARLRRTGREVAAMRALDRARDSALDRLGADLHCPRFGDELVWDPERRSPTTQPLPGGEDDDSYRARLRLLRGLWLATPGWAEELINGGRMADVGFAGRVDVDESPNQLLLAMRLVGTGRAALLDAVRRVHLIWPAGSDAGDAAHAARMLPAPVAERVARLRGRLNDWNLRPSQPLAPALAEALATLLDRCEQLGSRPWPALSTGQFDDGGSRFELGLGALLAPVNAKALDKAVRAARDLGLPGVVPVPRQQDPIGAWLLSACGLRTAEPTADGVFVSTLPMGPLVVDLAPGPDGPLPVTAAAHLVSASDAAHDTPIVAVMAAMTALGQTAVADEAALLAAMQPASAAPDLAQALQQQGVPAVADVDGFRQQLAAVSDRLYVAYDLGAAGAGPLAELLPAAAHAGASSVVGLITAAGTAAVLIGVTGLPLAGSNLAGRQTVLYRWQARGLAGDAFRIEPRRGATTTIFAPGQGVGVLSCVAHLRGDGNDPYEWSPVPADSALLTLRQYEHLMNLVELATPIGVRANTWRLRQQHVDADGSGAAIPLTAAAARTYRHYRATR